MNAPTRHRSLAALAPVLLAPLLATCRSPAGPREAPPSQPAGTRSSRPTASTQTAVLALRPSNTRTSSQSSSTPLGELPPSRLPTERVTTKLPPTPSGPLSATGPWLLIFRDGSSFWASNPDGSGLTQLVNGAHAVYGGLRFNPSPRGGLVTYVDETGQDVPRLRLISLRDRRVTTLAQLLPSDFWPSFEVEDAEDAELLYAAMQTYAAVTRSAGVWSEDGPWLAFVGAMDGPSSDLYLYSATTGRIVRLTDGPTETVSPVWSPDERYILHGSATDLNFNASGEGYLVTGVWAARPDGSGAQLVYPLDYRGFETVLGWISDTVFLVDSREALMDYSDMRTVDIETGEAKPVWDGSYTERAFDPGTQTVLFIRCDVAGEPGVYLLGLGDSTPRRVPGLEPNCTHHGVTWSGDAGLFFVETDAGVVPVTPEGALLDLGLTLKYVPSISPTGGLWAMSGDGVWIGTPQDGFRRLTDWDAVPIWRPDGEALFLFSWQGEPSGGYQLHVAHRPEFTPLLVARDLQLEDWTATWVQP